jgi:ubiquitin-activating enzyme E1
LRSFIELVQEHNLRLPRPYNEADAEELVKIAERLNAEGSFRIDLETDILKKLAYTAMGDLSPMAALFGGIVGQEALKAISGKFHPMFQFFYFDSEESLPEEKLKEEDCKPQVSLS